MSCSTAGCRRRATRSCDAPVKREPGTPKRGDTRLHREQKVVFYVWSVEGDEVTISTRPPGQTIGPTPPHMQTASVSDWFAKADATCDRPLCDGCAERVVAELDYCQPHASAARKALPAKG